MADRPGVMLYFDICPILDTLTPADMGLVLRAALEYAQHGTVPSFEGAAATAWAVMRPKIDKDGETYENKVTQRQYARYCRTAKSNGEQILSFGEWQNSTTVGSRSTGMDSEVRNLPTNNLQHTTNNLQHTTNNLQHTTTTRNKKRESNTHTGGFTPPGVGEVRDYCLSRGSTVDPEEFVDFYTSQGWMIGKTPMKDWKATLRGWERNREKKGREQNAEPERLSSKKWNLKTYTGE